MTPETQAQAREALLPCPWCGGQIVPVSVVPGSTSRWRQVQGCCADGPEVRHDTCAEDQEAAEEDSRRRAIEEWNRRPHPDAPAGGEDFEAAIERAMNCPIPANPVDYPHGVENLPAPPLRKLWSISENYTRWILRHALTAAGLPALVAEVETGAFNWNRFIDPLNCYFTMKPGFDVSESSESEDEGGPYAGEPCGAALNIMRYVTKIESERDALAAEVGRLRAEVAGGEQEFLESWLMYAGTPQGQSCCGNYSATHGCCGEPVADPPPTPDEVLNTMQIRLRELHEAQAAKVVK